MVSKSIVFLLRSAHIITIRRYLRIANELYNRYNIESIFLDVGNNGLEEIKKARNDISSFFSIEAECFTYVKLSDMLINKADEFSSHKPYGTKHALSNMFFDNHFESSVKLISTKYFSIEEFFFKHNIIATIIDIPVLFVLNIICDVSRNNNIPIFSLEHAEGLGKIYSNFINFADYYFAYGKYNIENLKIMGVKEEQILLTGSLDTDLIHRLDSQSFSQSVLIILKPIHITDAINLNKKLIEKVLKIFQRYKILIKPHPSVMNLEKEIEYLDAFCQNKSKLEIVDIQEPLNISLSKASICFTFSSFSVVESILMGKITIVIMGIQDEVYPDWSMFGVKVCDIESIGKDINDDTIMKYKISNSNNKKFLEYFRYKNDTKNLDRVVHEIFIKSIILNQGEKNLS